MYRTLLCKRLWPTAKPPVRRFHSTPCHRADTIRPGLTEYVASHSVAFHDFFQLVHDYTLLPWLLSIPIGTILFRSFLTPFRFYLAYRRRDQRLATSRLEFASTIIEKQNESRVAAGIDTPTESNAWKKSEWIKWRNEIDKSYPGAKPSVLVSTTTNLDASNLGAMAMVAINISTICSLVQQNPGIIELVGLETWGVAMSAVFLALAIDNTSYYHSDPGTDPDPEPRTVLQQSEDILSLKSKNIVRYYMPLAGACILSFMSGPVILSVLSGSAYTTVERKAIDFFTRVPYPVDHSQKATVQAMQAPEEKGIRKSHQARFDR